MPMYFMVDKYVYHNFEMFKFKNTLIVRNTSRNSLVGGQDSALPLQETQVLSFTCLMAHPSPAPPQTPLRQDEKSVLPSETVSCPTLSFDFSTEILVFGLHQSGFCVSQGSPEKANIYI